jgi:hypothetical protein
MVSKVLALASEHITISHFFVISRGADLAKVCKFSVAEKIATSCNLQYNAPSSVSNNGPRRHFPQDISPRIFLPRNGLFRARMGQHSEPE